MLGCLLRAQTLEKSHVPCDTPHSFRKSLVPKARPSWTSLGAFVKHNQQRPFSAAAARGSNRAGKGGGRAKLRDSVALGDTR